MSDDVWLDAPDREGFWYFDTDDCPDGLLIIGRAVVDSPRMKSGALYVRNGRNNIPIVQYCATNPGRWLRIPPPEELAASRDQLMGMAREAYRRQCRIDSLTDCLKLAYRHVALADPDVASGELGERLASELAETMGDEEFQEWVRGFSD
jgi:hypothetical protein